MKPITEYLNEATNQKQGSLCPDCAGKGKKSLTHTGLYECTQCGMLYDPNNKKHDPRRGR